ncbi:NLP/P60 protein [Niastella koreensis GR20-10]|uniref:NLP/P60 protein n=1 Tax=Niastella koreensis (strain DSM 17620 / KACC 11465 / NBRC 106392 / GR20-10) TaxID=700598 RepID=G8TGI1_NIAKG|nr:NlpC/P60 family protein [Niastella koreensis]AEV97404.1 NLP/P60 protein [Niastella koreensis GR20-10]
MKYLIIIISTLLVFAEPASARHPFGLYKVFQDGKSKKKTAKSTAVTTSKSKKVASPTTKLAALTPEEENKIAELKNRKVIGIELSAPLQFKYAILLDIPVEMINDNKLLELIDSWYGTKYKYGGDTREGVDCSGFTKAFMASYYDVTLTRNSAEMYANSKHLKKKKLAQGDLVFFKTKGAKAGITHVGVYLCNNKFVHASTNNGVIISDLGEDYYKSKFAGGGRVVN